MTKTFASFITVAIMATLALTQGSVYTNSINLQNTPGVQINATRDLQQLRDSWCNSTYPADARYNQSQIYYYRTSRSNFMGTYLVQVINYISGSGSTTDFIQGIRWPFGVLLTFLLVIFICWLLFLILFCCKKSQTATAGLYFGLGANSMCQLLFSGLFIVIIIFIGFSEVSQRRSKCQVLNVGNLLVNGYYSSISGTQYAGLTAFAQSVVNFQTEYLNAASLINPAKDIINANFPALVASNVVAVKNVAANYAGRTTFNAYGAPGTPFSIAGLTEWVNNGIKQEFYEFSDLGTSLNNAGQAVYDIIQSQSTTSGTQTLTSNLNAMNAFFINITSDTATSGLMAYNVVRWAYQWAAGGYWTIFALSIILSAIANNLSKSLTSASRDETKSYNIKSFKIMLFIFGFFMFWYAVLCIILLAGSGLISTFCTLIGNVNQGNLGILDTVIIPWQGNSKQVFKECVGGNTGNLWNFYSQTPNFPGFTNAKQIENIVRGLINYKAYYGDTNIVSSSSIANAISQYQSISAGLNNDFTGVDEMLKFVNSSWTSTSGIPTLTTWLCNTLLASQRSICLPIDTTPIVSYGSQATYSNFTIISNLQSYIQSENTLLNSLILNLDGSTTVLTPAQAYRNTKLQLDGRAASVASFNNVFKNTLNPYSQYQTSSTYLFDCRSIKRELAILEDHFCFELNYWIYIILVLSCISLCLLFAIGWSFFGVIGDLDTGNEHVIQSTPEPAAADINEREMIPQV